MGIRDLLLECKVGLGRVFGRLGQKGAIGTHADQIPACDPFVYCLESPKPQQIQWGMLNIISGWIFYLGDKTVAALEVFQGDQAPGTFAVNLPRPDVAIHIPMIEAAKTCGFCFEVMINGIAPLMVSVLFTDGSREELFCYELEGYNQQFAQWLQWKERLADMPQPSSELVYLTQGLTNIVEYQNNILPAVAMMRNYLIKAGVLPDSLCNTLDFGCGSGRLLLGWHIIQPKMLCHGCDINQRLLGWAQRYLPEALKFDNGQLLPPLAYADSSFDFMYLISVFTHLSLPIQQQWIKEFHRIIRPGGYLLITLQGRLYVNKTFHNEPAMVEEFERTGYAVVGSDEGSNTLGTFHHRNFAEQLFNGFRLLAYYPQGHLGLQRIVFPVAQSQDVYVFQRMENYR